jgi:plastocyanin
MHPLRASLARTVLMAGLLLAVVASPSASAQEATDDSVVFDEPAALEQLSPEAELIVAFDPFAVEPATVEPVIVEPVQVEPTVTSSPMPVPTATPAPTLVPTPTPAPAAAKVAATVVDNRFQPTALTIAVGSTVTWTNNGNNIHTLTSNDLFDSGGLLGGQSFSYTFDKAGTFRLICRQHGLNGMAGQVVVQ